MTEQSKGDIDKIWVEAADKANQMVDADKPKPAPGNVDDIWVAPQEDAAAPKSPDSPESPVKSVDDIWVTPEDRAQHDNAPQSGTVVPGVTNTPRPEGGYTAGGGVGPTGVPRPQIR